MQMSKSIYFLCFPKEMYQDSGKPAITYLNFCNNLEINGRKHEILLDNDLSKHITWYQVVILFSRNSPYCSFPPYWTVNHFRPFSHNLKHFAVKLWYCKTWRIKIIMIDVKNDLMMNISIKPSQEVRFWQAGSINTLSCLKFYFYWDINWNLKLQFT